VEAERGFTDLVGNNTALVSFSASVLANPSYLSPVDSIASYPQLTIEEQHLAVTRWYLHQQQKMGRWGEGLGASIKIKTKTKPTPTTPLVQSNSVDVALTWTNH